MFATSGPGGRSGPGICPPASWGIAGFTGLQTLAGTVKRTEEMHGTHASVTMTGQRPRTAQSIMAASGGRAVTPQVPCPAFSLSLSLSLSPSLFVCVAGVSGNKEFRALV